jgi:hypothetical protein
MLEDLLDGREVEAGRRSSVEGLVRTRGWGGGGCSIREALGLEEGLAVWELWDMRRELECTVGLE